MECSVCEVRSAVGYCARCQKLLCEVCGGICDGCGLLLCSEHRQRTAAGGVICQACAAKTEVNFTPGSGGVPPPPPAMRTKSTRAPGPDAAESFSFEALRDDLGMDVADTPQVAPELTPEMIARLTRQAAEENERNVRVLTGSSPKGTPIWLNCLFLGGMSCILTLPLVGSAGFSMFQPWMSYSVLLLSLGTILWALYGMTRDVPVKERRLCLIGLFLGIAATVVAFLVRHPHTPH